MSEIQPLTDAEVYRWVVLLDAGAITDELFARALARIRADGRRMAKLEKHLWNTLELIDADAISDDDGILMNSAYDFIFENKAALEDKTKCGHPPNNHFEFQHCCAREGCYCSRYVAGVVCGKLVKRKDQKDAHRDSLEDGIEDLIKRLRELEKALKDIAAPGYGIEAGDSDKEKAEYWARSSLRRQNVARLALAALDGGKGPHQAGREFEKETRRMRELEKSLREIEDIAANEMEVEHTAYHDIYTLAHALSTCHDECPVKREGLNKLAAPQTDSTS